MHRRCDLKSRSASQCLLGRLEYWSSSLNFGAPQSLLVEFKDHVVIIEGPTGDERENVVRLRLDVGRVAHVHGGVDSWDTVLKAVGRSTTN